MAEILSPSNRAGRRLVGSSEVSGGVLLPDGEHTAADLLAANDADDDDWMDF
jgi:hypothetical protein